MLTGITEIVASAAGLYVANVRGGSPAPYVYWAAPAAIVHAITAMHQTQLVFGAKLIMRPAYYMVAYMHLVSAVASLAAPEREVRLLAQYLVLGIFTWCRVYMALLGSFNFATGAVYSLSIILAGFTTGTFVMGPLAIVVYIFFLSISAALWRWSLGCSLYSTTYEELTRERVRTQLLDTAAMNAWKGLGAHATAEESAAAARKAFDRIDKDRSGALDPEEVVPLLGSLNVHPTVRRAIAERLEERGSISFDDFVRAIWSLGSKTAPEFSLAQLAAMTTPTEQARAVFDSIDLDKSGVLERFELAELLIQWGCPDDEVASYIAHVDVDGDGHIDFTEFLYKMEVIWKFGFGYVLHARATEKARRGWSVHDPDTPAGTAKSPLSRKKRA